MHFPSPMLWSHSRGILESYNRQGSSLLAAQDRAAMAISSTRVGLGVCQEQLPTYRLPKHTTQKAMSLKLHRDHRDHHGHHHRHHCHHCHHRHHRHPPPPPPPPPPPLPPRLSLSPTRRTQQRASEHVEATKASTGAPFGWPCRRVSEL